MLKIIPSDKLYVHVHSQNENSRGMGSVISKEVLRMSELGEHMDCK